MDCPSEEAQDESNEEITGSAAASGIAKDLKTMSSREQQKESIGEMPDFQNPKKSASENILKFKDGQAIGDIEDMQVTWNQLKHNLDTLSAMSIAGGEGLRPIKFSYTKTPSAARMEGDGAGQGEGQRQAQGLAELKIDVEQKLDGGILEVDLTKLAAAICPIELGGTRDSEGDQGAHSMEGAANDDRMQELIEAFCDYYCSFSEERQDESPNETGAPSRSNPEDFHVLLDIQKMTDIEVKEWLRQEVDKKWNEMEEKKQNGVVRDHDILTEFPVTREERTAEKGLALDPEIPESRLPILLKAFPLLELVFQTSRSTQTERSYLLNEDEEESLSARCEEVEHECILRLRTEHEHHKLQNGVEQRREEENAELQKEEVDQATASQSVDQAKDTVQSETSDEASLKDQIRDITSNIVVSDALLSSEKVTVDDSTTDIPPHVVNLLNLVENIPPYLSDDGSCRMWMVPGHDDAGDYMNVVVEDGDVFDILIFRASTPTAATSSQTTDTSEFDIEAPPTETEVEQDSPVR